MPTAEITETLSQVQLKPLDLSGFIALVLTIVIGLIAIRVIQKIANGHLVQCTQILFCDFVVTVSYKIQPAFYSIDAAFFFVTRRITV